MTGKITVFDAKDEVWPGLAGNKLQCNDLMWKI